MKPVLVALSLFAALPALAATEGISLGSSIEGRAAHFVDAALDSSFQLSEAPALRLTDGLRFALADNPYLDQGGAVSGETRGILALLLGLFVGFGTGHLVAKDRDGFILFLIIDIVILAVTGIFWGVVWKGGIFWGIGGLAFLISHIIQGIDAYGIATGDRLIRHARESDVGIAVAPGREQPVGVSRVFGLSF